MAWLALSPDVLVPTVTLAEKTKVPTHYLAKVLQQLASAELVTGRRGVRGGYKLARPAVDISLLNVVRAVSTIEPTPACEMGADDEGGRCPLHRTVDKATRLVIELLEERTLEDLVSESGGRPICEAEMRTRGNVAMASGKR